MTERREILFRGKCKTDGEWKYGCYAKGIEYLYHGEKHIIFDEDVTIFPHNEMCGFAEVIPETVGQYTGLTDKNGKRIYEGDIVAVKLENSNGENWEEIKKVHYNSDECCWYPMRWKEECDFCDGWTEIESIEVIGNIHDNPELLEV